MERKLPEFDRSNKFFFPKISSLQSSQKLSYNVRFFGLHWSPPRFNLSNPLLFRKENEFNSEHRKHSAEWFLHSVEWTLKSNACKALDQSESRVVSALGRVPSGLFILTSLWHHSAEWFLELNFAELASLLLACFLDSVLPSSSLTTF